MTYTEAVKLAMQGEECGFGYLYQNTYKSKLYLALQYMKNEEDAKDVLQDAYIKAFSRLGSLQDPEKFQAWLGQIVANTAKNALVKKTPVLFSDIASEEDGEPFEFRIEDEDISRQPELAYTKEETRQLVRELMDSLSEEQRICVLMFHIEGASIKEIAEALDRSENTVKSRLNYGRKNIKRKAEDLQKKGCKLYGLAPLPFLLLLFRKDAYALSAEKSFTGAGGEVADQVFKEFPFTGNGASASQSDTAGQRDKNQSYADAAGMSGAGRAAGTGLLHSAAGKALAAVAAVAVIGGTAFGVTRMNHNKANEQPGADKTAILHKNENGNFQIVTISEAGSTADTESSEEQASAVTSDASTILTLYEEALQNAGNGAYTFSDTYGDPIEGYYYFVTDMDNDGVPELVVGAQYLMDVFYWYDCIVFDVESGELKQIDGSISILSAYISSDENGFLGMTDFGRATGQTDIHRITIQSGTLFAGYECDFISGSSEETQFLQENTIVEWTEISDYSGLDELKENMR